MSRASSNIRGVTAAQRGQIIQHVMVDGWSAAQAAAAYRIPERHVARWLAAYRRHGMASLHDDAAADAAPRRWMRRLRAVIMRMLAVCYGNFDRKPARCIILPRRNDEAGPRRSLWN
jgi:hypothetical protein